MEVDGPLIDQPVYISRRMLSSQSRQVVNERLLEDILIDNGFGVIYPERLSIREQIRVFARHRTIVTTVGSAAHGILFGPPDVQLHLLTHGRFIPRNYPLVSAIATVHTTFINALHTGGRPLTGGNQSTPQIVDYTQIVNHLESVGLIRSRTRLEVLNAVPGNDVQYIENWLYSAVRESIGQKRPLSESLQREARWFATSSWPVALMMIRYDLWSSNTLDIENSIDRCCDLIRQDTDLERLMRYRNDFLTLASTGDQNQLLTDRANLELQQLATAVFAAPTS
jgi:hypothetical protein